MTAPLQVRDLQVQAGQHGQVLLLQEADPSPHTGHLQLKVPLIHGSVSPARRCWQLKADFSCRMADLGRETHACLPCIPITTATAELVNARLDVFIKCKSIVLFTFMQM